MARMRTASTQPVVPAATSGASGESISNMLSAGPCLHRAVFLRKDGNALAGKCVPKIMERAQNQSVAKILLLDAFEGLQLFMHSADPCHKSARAQTTRNGSVQDGNCVLIRTNHARIRIVAPTRVTCAIRRGLSSLNACARALARLA